MELMPPRSQYLEYLVEILIQNMQIIFLIFLLHDYTKH